MASVLWRWTGGLAVCAGCTAPNPAFDVGPTVAGTGSEATTAMAMTTGATTEVTTGATEVTTGATETTTEVTTEVTTGSSGSATDDSSGGSVTGMSAVCGNGIVEPGEVCDAGPAPPLEPGACRPNCAGEIGARTIFVTKEPVTGGFATGADIKQADDVCAETAAGLGLIGEFGAMIADGTRYAAKQPYDGDCSADWPIQRYTAYVNLQNELVWVTGEIRLLGVRKAAAPGEPNVHLPLLAVIDPQAEGVWTGLASTWQTAMHCMQWQGAGQVYGTVGDTSKVEGFLDAGGDQHCAADYHLVCVQQ